MAKNPNKIWTYKVSEGQQRYFDAQRSVLRDKMINKELLNTQLKWFNLQEVYNTFGGKIHVIEFYFCLDINHSWLIIC